MVDGTLMPDPSVTTTVFDDLVVGAGSAGAALAARLSEDPDRRVLLVEAGPDHPALDDGDRLTNVMTFAQALTGWNLSAHVTGGRTVGYAQGRLVGGGSGVNGALALRGLPGDYDGWAAEGNPDWSWNRLLPHFTRLESDADADGGTLHGAHGPLPIVRWDDAELVPVQRSFRAAARELGFRWARDHNDPASTGIGPFPMNRRGELRVSTAEGYLRDARRRPNLTIRTSATVARVLLDGGRAVGVEAALGGGVEAALGGGLAPGDGGERVAISARRVTVCAGAIQTPALLWRSGIGPAEKLRTLGLPVVVDNPFVGENLLDHPGTLVFAVPEDGACDPSGLPYQLGIRWTSHAGGGVANDMLTGLMNYWDTRADPELRAAAGVDHVMALTCGVHEPRSRGRVTLTSPDPAIPPAIDFAMLSDPADEARLVEGLRLIRALAGTTAMKGAVRRLLLDDAAFDDDAALRRYVRETVSPWYHASGTCRMGPDPGRGAVVDQQLRVHGLAGLRVADASVMPSLPRAATNLTVIAIAEKAADLLRAGL